MTPPALFVRCAVIASLISLSNAETIWLGNSGSTSNEGGTFYGNWTSSPNWTNSIGINNTLDVVVEEVTANDGRVFMNPDADGFTDNEIWVAYNGPSKMGSLTINGGILQHSLGGSRHKTTRIGDAGNGTITQNGGTFFMNTGEMRIGNNNTAGGVGIYLLNGGTLSTTGGLYPGGQITINRNKLSTAPSRGELRISGTSTLDLGPPDGDGAVLGFGPGSGTPASSILTIVGAEATALIDSIRMTTASANTNTNVIRFAFDETGVSTIQLTGDFVYDGTNSASAILSSGELDVDYLGTSAPPTGTTYDLMVGDVILNDGTFAVAPALADNWSMEIIGTQTSGDDSNDVLRLTFLGGSIPTTRLVAYWPFDQNTNPQPDAAGLGNDATPSAGATWAMDPIRSSGVMQLDGADSFLEAADSESLSLTENLTIAAWVNVTDFSGFRSIVGKTESNLPSSYDFYLNAGDARANFLVGSPLLFAGSTSTLPVAAGEWHHVAVTLNAGEITFYYNGVTSGSGMNASPLLDSTAPLLIGNRADLATDFLGSMDDVAIFDGSLSPAQINTIMNGDFDQFTGNFAIREISYDPSGPSVSFSFGSSPGRTYVVEYSTSLAPDSWIEIDDSFMSQGHVSTYTDTQGITAGPRVFYRVRK